MNSKRATIKDIAEKASVSGTTISRYLNGKFEYMSAETKKRIEEVIDEVGYRPSNIARTLKSNKSMLIGAIIADIENPFSNQIIKGLTDKADELGYSLLISISDNSLQKENLSIERFLDNQVDGLIVNTVGENEPTLEKLQQRLPVVLIDRNVSGFQADVVTSNNYELGCQLMEHLMESGFQSIGFFTQNTANNSVRETRHRAFTDTMQQRPDLTGKTYVIDKSDCNGIVRQLEDFLELPGPRVIFAGNGVVQLSILQALKGKGYRLEKDFQLCGYDDWDWTPLIGENGITAVGQDSYGLGTEAITVLHDRISGKAKKSEPVYIEVKGYLTVRGSTKVQ